VWFCVVCLTESGGDWDELEEAIITRDRRRSSTSTVWEHKRSHLVDLRGRMDAAGLTAHDLAAALLDDKALRTRARRKVLDQLLDARDLTRPMRETPRRRLRERALRGHWSSFPVSPAEDEALFADVSEDERGGYRLVAELRDIVAEEHAARVGDPAAQLALLRAALSVGVEAFRNGLRDADGSMGAFLGETIEAYSRLPWRETGIEPTTYWTDLCEWCVWEEWGILHRRETVPFRSARKRDVDLIEGILLDLEAEYRSHRLDYEAAEALQLVAWLAVATRSADRFVPAATRLRADWWMPIDAMGQAAAKAGEHELAAEVYGTAIAGGGRHVDHLARLCHERAGLPPTLPR
jgi:hypothetical protein